MESPLIAPEPGSDLADWRLRLPGWADMGERVDHDAPRDGTVDVVFGTGEDDYDDLARPTAAQLAHVDWLVANHVTLMRDVVLEAALRLYRAYRMDMVDPGAEDEDLPRRADRAEMAAAVLPTQIHLTSLPGLDVPYVGVRLSREWDDEHDLGILCRGNELVDLPGDQHIDAFSAAAHEADPRGVKLLDEQGYEIP